MRGSHTHGGGAKKKRRGAGHRGGRGNAGSGKRGDAKKPSYWKNPLPAPKFKSRQKPDKVLNISDIEIRFENLLKSGVMEKQGDIYAVDLTKMKVDKLLATGTPTRKYKITVGKASKKAVEKIKAKQGEVLADGMV